MTPDSGILQGHEMDEDEPSALLVDQGTGVLSMAKDDRPYGIPLSFGYDGDDRLYFLFAGHSEAGRKVTYAERSETVSFAVYDTVPDDTWRSAIVEGPFDRIIIDDWDAAREAMADNAYRANLLTNVDRPGDPRVWALDIEDWSGRKSDPEQRPRPGRSAAGLPAIPPDLKLFVRRPSKYGRVRRRRRGRQGSGHRADGRRGGTRGPATPAGRRG